MTYTIFQAAEELTIPEFTTEDPSLCPIEYRLLDASSNEISTTTYDSLI